MSRLKQSSFTDIERYRLPIYCNRGKEKYVYFYVLDPDSVISGNPKLKRVKKKFTHIKSKKERDETALRFRDEISIKLRAGWNPFIQNPKVEDYAKAEDIFGKYEIYLQKMAKDKVLTNKTVVDYLSRFRQLKMFCSLKSNHLIYIYQFDKKYIESFLDYIYFGRDTTPLTRNNYLRWISSFCSWMEDKGFIKENFAKKIPLLREGEKRRKPLSHEDMVKLAEYLAEENPDFLIACQIHYYTLVRPTEMSNLRLRDISIHNQTIFISKEISKNRHDGVVTVPKKVLEGMIDRGYFNYPANYYLFGADFRPAKEKVDARIFREYWVKIRKKLHWPEEYQFYSLKDTGISDTIERVGLIIAKDQARHSSIEITNRYVRKEQLKAHPELKNIEGDL